MPFLIVLLEGCLHWPMALRVLIRLLRRFPPPDALKSFPSGLVLVRGWLFQAFLLYKKCSSAVSLETFPERCISHKTICDYFAHSPFAIQLKANLTLFHADFWKEFLPEICREVNPETAPPSSVLCLLLYRQSIFRGGGIV